MLMSKDLPGSSGSQCVSFWYYMYEPIVDNTGPNLGKLAVWIRTFDRNDNLIMTPIWRLQNGQGPTWQYAQAKIESETDYQIVFEGVWGNSRVSGYVAIDDVTFYEGDCSSKLGPVRVLDKACAHFLHALDDRRVSSKMRALIL